MYERRLAQIIREIRPGGERVLVVIMNNLRDWQIVRERGWYRIPVRRAPRRVGADYLAFYFTGAFPIEERHKVIFYAPIRSYRLVTRLELIPDEPDHPRAHDMYFQVCIGPLQRLQKPIPSHRLRRITFIPTTLGKLLSASEINDLWDKKPQLLWDALRSPETGHRPEG